MERHKMKIYLVRQPASVPRLPSRQRGVVLLVSLLFLIVLTLLGVSASRMVTGEEKMSRYLREYNTAFQAAESAMRDARDDVDGRYVAGGRFTSRFNAKASYFADCSFGQCQFDPTETAPPWMDETKWANATDYGTYSKRSPLPKSASVGTNAAGARDENEGAAVRFDAGTASSAVTGVWKQPAYLVESIPDQRPGANSVVFGKVPPPLYRITARGYGADPNSRAMIQEVYTSSVAALDGG
jgi:type IV pilus assembly protein PilX